MKQKFLVGALVVVGGAVGLGGLGVAGYFAYKKYKQSTYTFEHLPKDYVFFYSGKLAEFGAAKEDDCAQMCIKKDDCAGYVHIDVDGPPVQNCTLFMEPLTTVYKHADGVAPSAHIAYKNPKNSGQWEAWPDECPSGATSVTRKCKSGLDCVGPDTKLCSDPYN